MAKLNHWIKRHLPTQRRFIQLYTALLYNAHVKGFIQGNIYTGSTKALCVPGLNCYSCPGAIGACPLGALQNAIAASGSRTPTYIIGILLLYGLIFGRTICGFLCPFGLLQELLHKLPTPKIPKGSITRILSWFKYILLLILVLIIPLWYALQSLPVPAFCKYICPAGTLEGAVGLLSNPVNSDKYSMLGGLFTWKFVLLLAIIAVCVFIYRAFCRFVCPLGAIYGMFSKLAMIGVKVDLPMCTDCRRCIHKCKMDISHVGDHECIHCGECIDVCPTKAISFKAGKVVLRGPQNASEPSRKPAKRTRIVAWLIALAVLILCVAIINQPDPAPDLPIGNEPGMLAPDFTVELNEGKNFVLSEYRGKKVVVNFWATWCTPCCNELPYFEEIHHKYGDEVAVISIHSDLITDDVQAYLSKYDYSYSFAIDETGEIIKSFGGSTMLPLTVIIDEQGIITYNAVGSVTVAQLENLLNLSSTPD